MMLVLESYQNHYMHRANGRGGGGTSVNRRILRLLTWGQVEVVKHALCRSVQANQT